jgi:glutathione S-transferase
MNPQHTVPTLVDDDGFTIWDSPAFLFYLVAKSAKHDSLYPKDLKKRAIIDQRLHFESGVVFATLRNIAVGALTELLGSN